MTTDPLVPIIDALARGDTAFVATLVSRYGAVLAASALRAGVQPGVAGAPPIDHLVQEVALAVAELAPHTVAAEPVTALVDRSARLVAERGFAPACLTVSDTAESSLPASPSRQLSLFSAGRALHLSAGTLRASLDEPDVYSAA